MNNLLPSRFYLFHLIFHTCLLSSPLSAVEINVISSTPKAQLDYQERSQTLQICIEKRVRALPKPHLDDKKKKALFEAIKDNNIEKVKWFLNIYEDVVSARGQYEVTPFHCAALNGYLEIAKLLKERDANVHEKDEWENNALHLACYSGKVEMVSWLLDDCHIDIEAKVWNQYTPFLCAVTEGQLEIAKRLKQHGAMIDAKDRYENNALHFACRWSDNNAMVSWLLDDCHIEIEAKGGCYKRTPFLCAVQEGQLEIAKLLKQRGANIDAKDKDQKNALDLAPSEDVNMKNWLLNECNLKEKSWLEGLLIWFIG